MKKRRHSSDGVYRSPTKLFKGKRAQGPESQINWVFVLIVGALIIAFFTVIVMKQRGASEIKVSATLTKQLNTIFVGAKVSSGTVQEIPTPMFEVRFACNDYYIGQVSQRLGNRIIFAPEDMKTNMIQTWTLDWNVPYKVATFLYVTHPRIRYVLVNNGAFQDLKQLNLSLPVKLNRNFKRIDYDISDGSDYMSLTTHAEDHTRFIFIGGDESFLPVVPPGFYDETGSALQVFGGANKLRFFEMAGASFTDLTSDSLFGSGGPVPYINYETMLGAIFSDDPKIYACIVGKAWKTWNIVTQVFISKFNSVADKYHNTSCEGFYKDNFDFETIMETTDHGFSLDNPGIESDIGSLGAAIQNLKRTNERAQLSSCPLLY